MPGAPRVFFDSGQPKVSVQLGNHARKLNEGDYEIVLEVTVTAEINDKTAYIAEVKQAGIFAITGAAKEEVDQLVGAYCPSILFPYLRETIASLTGKGSFPPFYLQPISFDALYQQAQAKRAEEGNKETAH